MSNEIPDLETGKNVYINDVHCGRIMIGDYVFHYSDLLPIIEHYVRGGLAGFSHCRVPIPVGIPDNELQAVRDFIKNVGELEEVQERSTQNTMFVRKSELNAWPDHDKYLRRQIHS